ncbi:MAG TPA: HAD family phosphatase [Pyrinomonadaceae bacterium]|nr:HAD family phosphatase [Pyrinomonadaceae bacterium]
MIQAILFDFNGVVVDDEPLQMKAYQRALASEGVALAEADYYSLLGTDDETFLRRTYERAERELTGEKFAEVLEAKSRAHRELLTDAPPLFPGVVNFVKALSREYALGVVSMARRGEIEYVFERAALNGLFDVVVAAEDVTACKPDPGCYNSALELLNRKRGDAHIVPLQPAECLVIEDAPPGIESARRAGMRTLGVTNTVGEKELRAAGADIVTHSLADWTVDAVRHVFDYR